ncbi:RNA polymerase sigma factor [Ectothiorhodospira marina]|uniref:RNA polymerase sigma-70 factor, ECF subfamily n=1 Tax=Ectothiorhodospira marina TaxID=1396821 RepID=A0A1H7PY53_9GAMM|nr:RNA polymerase sigma factor [Ectothiorhodospira marina]SEL40672.1 RNA polymerase sigma-70 factor, ECF subfamily [Ectothiorhodospira marina]
MSTPLEAWPVDEGTVSASVPEPKCADGKDAFPVPVTLEAFLEGVQNRAVRMAALALGDQEAALDLVQDAMVALIDRYRDRPPEAWGPLFWRILQSRIRDTYRRRRVRQRVLAVLGWSDDEDREDPLNTLPDSFTPGPDQALADGRFAQDLESALRALPLRQQQAFLLRHWEGLDTSATAAALGISEGSVKTHLYRALQSLQGHLEAYR